MKKLRLAAAKLWSGSCQTLVWQLSNSGLAAAAKLWFGSSELGCQALSCQALSCQTQVWQLPYSGLGSCQTRVWAKLV